LRVRSTHYPFRPSFSANVTAIQGQLLSELGFVGLTDLLGLLSDKQSVSVVHLNVESVILGWAVMVRPEILVHPLIRQIPVQTKEGMPLASEGIMRVNNRQTDIRDRNQRGGDAF
jgi:hypothetical protein